MKLTPSHNCQAFAHTRISQAILDGEMTNEVPTPHEDFISEYLQRRDQWKCSDASVPAPMLGEGMLWLATQEANLTLFGPIWSGKKSGWRKRCFGKRCFCLRDPTIFVIFVGFRGLRSTTPCFLWVECKSSFSPFLVKTTRFRWGAKTPKHRFPKTLFSQPWKKAFDKGNACHRRAVANSPHDTPLLGVSDLCRTLSVRPLCLSILPSCWATCTPTRNYCEINSENIYFM